MKILIVCLFLLAVMLVLVFISLVTVTIHCIYEEHHNQLTVGVVALFGLVSKTFSYPVPASVQENAPDWKKDIQGEEREHRSFIKRFFNDFRSLKGLLHFLAKSKPIMKWFLKRTVVKEFLWVSTFGTKDAALTGKLIGAVWGVKGIVQMLLYQLFTVRTQPFLNVEPMFNNRVVYSEFRCIFSIRVGDAILTALKLLYNWKSEASKNSPSLFFKTNKTV